MRTVKRTFQALAHVKGSEERAKFNTDWITSEYMPSYRYGVRNDDGSATPFTYRTKAEADAIWSANLKTAYGTDARNKRYTRDGERIAGYQEFCEAREEWQALIALRVLPTVTQ